MSNKGIQRKQCYLKEQENIKKKKQTNTQIKNNNILWITEESLALI